MFKRYIKIIKKTPNLFDKNISSTDYQLEEYFGAKRPEYDMIKRGYISLNISNPLSDLYSDEGKTIKLKTIEQKQKEIDIKEQKLFQDYYKKNNQLIKYVYQYKKILDTLKIPYTYNINEILNKIKSISMIETEKLKLCFTITDILNNIVLNLEELGIIGARTYTAGNIDKFIKYLPSNIKIKE